MAGCNDAPIDWLQFQFTLIEAPGRRNAALPSIISAACFKPVSREFSIRVWSDRELKAGSRWRDQIKRAIDECAIAILLVSADFLASDFIHEDELPPLLLAAEQKGKLILPVIVGPCLFLRRQDISAFLSVNDPARPLIALPVGEAEAVLRDVAERVLDHKEIPRLVKSGIESGREDFMHPSTWSELAKIGNWVLDPQENHILGSGMHAYLLSRREFGIGGFVLTAIVSFTPLPMKGRAAELGMNAGIVLGYQHTKPNPRYVNVAFTGTTVFVEQVGFKGGSVVRDYQHVTEAVPFTITPGQMLHIRIAVAGGAVHVNVDGKDLVHANSLLGLEGRVGLRPWRSTVVCSGFMVVEPASSATMGQT